MKEEKGRFSDLNFLGIPLDPTLGVADKALEHVDESVEAEKRKQAASKYWMPCPSCGKRVVKKELIENGCYSCGWKGKEGDIPAVRSKEEAPTPYRRKCAHCGTLVITEELMKKGCYVCGYKPEAEVK